jgi:hypothetical protein
MYFTMALNPSENSRLMSSWPSWGCTCVEVAIVAWAEQYYAGAMLDFVVREATAFRSD